MEVLAAVFNFALLRKFLPVEAIASSKRGQKKENGLNVLDLEGILLILSLTETVAR